MLLLLINVFKLNTASQFNVNTRNVYSVKKTQISPRYASATLPECVSITLHSNGCSEKSNIADIKFF